MMRILDGLNLKTDREKDKAILINDNEIRIINVIAQNEESIHTGQHVLPKADAQVKYFPEGGRAFIYNCSANYLTESENIAKLEKSTVLKNIFDYGHTAKAANIQFYIMVGVLIITIFLLRH